MLELAVWLPTLTTEATALGAVVAGGIGVGLFADFNVVDRLISLHETEQPDPARHEQYRALLDLFRQTYEALDPIFSRLAGFTAVKPGLNNEENRGSYVR